eukprot:gene9928-7798_t
MPQQGTAWWDGNASPFPIEFISWEGDGTSHDLEQICRHEDDRCSHRGKKMDEQEKASLVAQAKRIREVRKDPVDRTASLTCLSDGEAVALEGCLHCWAPIVALNTIMSWYAAHAKADNILAAIVVTESSGGDRRNPLQLVCHQTVLSPMAEAKDEAQTGPRLPEAAAASAAALFAPISRLLLDTTPPDRIYEVLHWEALSRRAAAAGSSSREGQQAGGAAAVQVSAATKLNPPEGSHQSTSSMSTAPSRGGAGSLTPAPSKGGGGSLSTAPRYSSLGSDDDDHGNNQDRDEDSYSSDSFDGVDMEDQGVSGSIGSGIVLPRNKQGFCAKGSSTATTTAGRSQSSVEAPLIDGSQSSVEAPLMGPSRLKGLEGSAWSGSRGGEGMGYGGQRELERSISSKGPEPIPSASPLVSTEASTLEAMCHHPGAMSQLSADNPLNTPQNASSPTTDRGLDGASKGTPLSTAKVQARPLQARALDGVNMADASAWQQAFMTAAAAAVAEVQLSAQAAIQRLEEGVAQALDQLNREKNSLRGRREASASAAVVQTQRIIQQIAGVDESVKIHLIETMKSVGASASSRPPTHVWRETAPSQAPPTVSPAQVRMRKQLEAEAAQHAALVQTTMQTLTSNLAYAAVAPFLATPVNPPPAPVHLHYPLSTPANPRPAPVHLTDPNGPWFQSPEPAVAQAQATQSSHSPPVRTPYLSRGQYSGGESQPHTPVHLTDPNGPWSQSPADGTAVAQAQATQQSNSPPVNTAHLSGGQYSGGGGQHGGGGGQYNGGQGQYSGVGGQHHTPVYLTDPDQPLDLNFDPLETPRASPAAPPKQQALSYPQEAPSGTHSDIPGAINSEAWPFQQQLAHTRREALTDSDDKTSEANSNTDAGPGEHQIISNLGTTTATPQQFTFTPGGCVAAVISTPAHPTSSYTADSALGQRVLFKGTQSPQAYQDYPSPHTSMPHAADSRLTEQRVLFKETQSPQAYQDYLSMHTFAPYAADSRLTDRRVLFKETQCLQAPQDYPSPPTSSPYAADSRLTDRRLLYKGVSGYVDRGNIHATATKLLGPTLPKHQMASLGPAWSHFSHTHDSRQVDAAPSGMKPRSFRRLYSNPAVQHHNLQPAEQPKSSQKSPAPEQQLRMPPMAAWQRSLYGNRGARKLILKTGPVVDT